MKRFGYDEREAACIWRNGRHLPEAATGAGRTAVMAVLQGETPACGEKDAKLARACAICLVNKYMADGGHAKFKVTVK